jgi:hypothetical protein
MEYSRGSVIPGIYKLQHFQVTDEHGQSFWLSTDATLEVNYTFQDIPLLGISIDPRGIIRY